jgi:hypothetical protein
VELDRLADKNWAVRDANGPSLGRKRPRRAAVAQALPHRSNIQCNAQNARGSFGGRQNAPTTVRPMKERWAACGCRRPKSREETPKEGDGNARRCRTATTCRLDRKKARYADLFVHANMQCWPSLATSQFQLKLLNRSCFSIKINMLCGIPPSASGDLIEAARHRGWRTAADLTADLADVTRT